MSEYVKVQNGAHVVTVTAKAARTIYADKGYSVIGKADAPPKRDDSTPPDPSKEAEDEEREIEIKAILRRSEKNILAWVEEATEPGERIERAERVFEAESRGRNREPILEAVSAIALGERGGEASG